MDNKPESKQLILAVDDQPNNLKVLSSVLNKTYSLSLANNGKMALKILDKIKPDLILLDIMMPEMDGFETCKEIKAKPEFADVPVIFLTARTEIEDVVKGFELGAVDYITKPFNISELRVRINNHISLFNAKKKIDEQKKELENKNAELVASEQNLTKANNEKDKFFSIIAHDLKSPFSGLNGLLYILVADKDKIDDEERDDIIDSLYKSSKNVYSLLENLLEWSRIQKGAINLYPENTRPFEIIKVLKDLLSVQSSEKEISVETDIREDLVIIADQMMLNTIFRNLISNALKFTPDGGKIKSDYRKIDGYHQFSVEDNGIGMSDKIKSRLFKIDEKVTSLGTNNEKGTGLGLILCKEFVEMHGGKIWVESEVGKGTTFYFTISDSLEIQEFTNFED